MIGKKINQLATELAPVSTDLTIIGDPISGVSKKITLAQLGAIFSGAVSFYDNLASFPAVGDINVIYCAKDTKKLYLWSGSAYTEVFPSQALLDTYQLRSEKGNANGYASLDSGGKVPISQLPSSIMEYKGTWNASTNTPTLANGTGDTGDVYICNVAGTVNFGAGPITFAVGDYTIYSGSIWQRSSGAVGTVTSVALSRSGDALAITGSPVTTSGTINVGFAGNSTQYINGAGNLVTFPGVINEAQNLITEVYNKTGATLTKGTVVYINGGQGNLPSVTKALATGDSTSAQTYGIVRNDITNNNNGYVVVAGRISDLDTQAYTEGTQLYLSPTTAGTYTSTKPYAPQHLVYVGIVVRAHPTQGVIEVKIQNGYELDELHNVAAQSPSNGDILQYKTATSLWTKVAGTTSNIAEGSNLYYTDARSRAAISETVTGLDYNNTTGVLSLTSGYVIPTTTNETNWNAAYNDKINSAAVTGTTTKTLTLTQQDGGTITASWTDDNTDAVTSVFGRTGAVVAVSGDYTTAQVTESGNLYFTNARAIASTLTGYTSGAGTITSADSILSAIQKLNGNIGALTTGVSSVNGLTGAVTLTTSNIAEGTNLYYTEARVNANTNVAANTAARHNAVTLGTANGLSLSTQVLSLGLASTSTTGALSSTDWNTFNNKTSNTGTVTSVGLSSATSGVTIGSTPITTSGTITLAIATASGSQQGLLSSTDWTTFNNKQSALTNPVTGTGTTNYLPKFTGSTTVGNSQVFDNGTNVGIGTASNTTYKLQVAETGISFGSADKSLLKLNSGNTTEINFIQRNVSGFTGTLLSSSDALAFGTLATIRMTLDASGNLGLGVTPSAWSVLRGLQNGMANLVGYVSNSEGAWLTNNAFYNGTSWVYQTSSQATMYQQLSGVQSWHIAASGTAGNAISFTQAMTLDASGRLGIGVTNMSSYNAGGNQFVIGGGEFRGLTIAATTEGNIYFADGTTGADSYRGTIGYNHTSNYLYFFSDGSERMRITSGGLVGIGTSAPAFQLDVVKAGANAIRVQNTDSAADAYFIAQNTTGTSFFGTNNIGPYIYTASALAMQFYTNNAERMRITSGGNVEINTGSIKTGEPDTGWGRAAIKIGARVSGTAFGVGGYLPVSVDGTVYYINLNSSTP